MEKSLEEALKDCVDYTINRIKNEQEKRDAKTKDKTINDKDLKLELLPVLDGGVGMRKDRLLELMMDSISDPQDKFHVHMNHIDFPKLQQDYNDEYYLLTLSNDEKAVKDIGWISLSKFHVERLVRITFYLKKENRKQGWLTQCVPLIGERVFMQLGYNKIEAECMQTNKVAVSTYAKHMKLEGVRRQHSYYAGKYIDKHLYGVTYNESMWAGKR